jgi:hypothetical protein
MPICDLLILTPYRDLVSLVAQLVGLFRQWYVPSAQTSRRPVRYSKPLYQLADSAWGLVRCTNRGAFTERRDVAETVAPMSIGSVIGAIVGGLLVGIVPAAVLKIGLGRILIISAVRIFQHSKAK